MHVVVQVLFQSLYERTVLMRIRLLRRARVHRVVRSPVRQLVVRAEVVRPDADTQSVRTPPRLQVEWSKSVVARRSVSPHLLNDHGTVSYLLHWSAVVGFSSTEPVDEPPVLRRVVGRVFPSVRHARRPDDLRRVRVRVDARHDRTGASWPRVST